MAKEDGVDPVRQFSLRLKQSLLDKLHRLSEDTGRSITAEITSAIRRHLAQPPIVTETLLPLPEEKLPPRKRTGGRPYSGGYEEPPRRKTPDDGEGDD